MFFFCVSFIKEMKRVLIHKNGKEIFSVLIVYLVINTIVFRCIYPGNWCGDELWMLSNITGYNMVSAQHWITVCFYIASFMLFPSPIGVFLLFQAVILYILMYMLRVLSDDLNHNKFIWATLISFSTGNVLLYNFYPLRCSIYGWLLILFYVSVFIDKERNAYKIFVSAVLICSLRSEGVIWLIVIGGIMFSRQIKRKQIWLMTMIAVFSGMIIKYQNHLFSSMNGDYNLVTAVLDPMKELIMREYETVGEESQLLSYVNETIDIDVLLNNAETGMGIFFNHYVELFRNKQPAVSSNFIKAYVQLIKKYPDVFLKERKTTFIRTMKQTSLILCNNTEKALSDDNQEPFVYVKYFNGFHVKNAKLREHTLNVLSLKNCHLFVRQICTGFFLPISFVLMGIWRNIRKRKWDESVFLIGIGMHIATVILTMPGIEFMYFYPIYLFGSFYGNIMVIRYLDKKHFKAEGRENEEDTLIYSHVQL